MRDINIAPGMSSSNYIAMAITACVDRLDFLRIIAFAIDSDTGRDPIAITVNISGMITGITTPANIAGMTTATEMSPG